MNQKQSMWSGRYLLIWLAASMLLIAEGFRTTCMSLFIMPIAQDWNTTTASVLVYASIASIIGLFFLPLWGRWIAKYGVKNCVLVAGIATTAVLVGWSMSNGLTLWYILAGVIGVFGAGAGALAAITAASQWFIEKRSTVIGIIIAFLSVGGVIGSAVLPSIIVASGWQKAMLIMAIANGLLTIPVAFALKTPDKYGYVPLGFKNIDPSAAGRPASVELPGLPASHAYKMPLFYVVSITMLLLYLPSAFMANLPTWGVLQGFEPIQAGLLVSYGTLVGIVGTILVGAFNERFGVKVTTLAFLGIGILGLLAFLIAQSYGIALLAIILLAIGYSYMVAMPSILVLTIFGPKDFSKLQGMISIMPAIAGIVAVPGLAWIQNTTGTYDIGFWIMAALWVIAIAAVIYSIRLGASAQADYATELAQEQQTSAAVSA